MPLITVHVCFSSGRKREISSISREVALAFTVRVLLCQFCASGRTEIEPGKAGSGE